MRIGIDIDDTITNTWEYIMPIFSEKFNIPIEQFKESGAYYDSIKHIVSFDEYLNLIKKYEHIMQDVPLKENVKEIITKLKEEGNTIIFITARGTNSYSNPYLISKNYLNKHKIPYDKLIVNAYKKGTICKEEKIDLFIDDNIKNCTDVSNQGIDVLMMSASFNESDTNYIHMKDWNQVYEYINNR